MKTPTFEEIHQNAIKKGYWEPQLSFGDVIALCHEELSEALKEKRNGFDVNQIHYSITNEKPHFKFEPKGIPIELADCVFRPCSHHVMRD